MEIFVSCKFFAHYFRTALYFLLPRGLRSLEAVPSLAPVGVDGYNKARSASGELHPKS